MKKVQKTPKSFAKITKRNTISGRYLGLLSRLGLGEKESRIFETLLVNGEMGAGEIISLTSLKRGDAYNHIYSLMQKGLLEETSAGGWKRFRLEHPSRIEEYIENQSKELTEARKELSGMLPAMLSAYNLAYHKPGVKVFEGEDAPRIVLEDTLKAKTEILALLDPESIYKYAPEANRWYQKEKKIRSIKKKNLFFDSKFNREILFSYKSENTENRLIGYQARNLGTSLQIYDNTISFLNIKQDTKIGIIIDDLLIADLMRNMFNALWESHV